MGRWWLAFVVLMVAGPAWADPAGGTVRVLVTDDLDLPISGARIDVSGDRGTTTHLTNDLGQVVVPLAVGAWRVDVSKPHFADVALTNVVVHEGRESTLPVLMRLDDAHTELVWVGTDPRDRRLPVPAGATISIRADGWERASIRCERHRGTLRRTIIGGKATLTGVPHVAGCRVRVAGGAPATVLRFDADVPEVRAEAGGLLVTSPRP